MKMNRLFFLILPIFIAFSCDKKDNDEDNHQKICFNKVYSPYISLEEYSNYSIDIDGDNIDDLTFSSNPDAFGISANLISTDVEISKGIMPFSGSYHVIKENDTINENLHWYQSLPLVGNVNNTYYGEEIDYLGLRKKVEDLYFYGWMSVISSDSSLKITELYFLNSSNLHVLSGNINDTCYKE